MDAELEEGKNLALDFDKLAALENMRVVPTVAQDAETGTVLIVAYSSSESLRYTLERRRVAFWSTSRNELWVKGASSGDELELIEARVNCEQNSLLFLVRLLGKGACHTKASSGSSRLSCFYRKLVNEKELTFVEEGK